MGDPLAKQSPPRRRRLARTILLTTLAASVGIAAAIGWLYRAATAAVPEYETLVDTLDAQQATGELDQHRQQLESQVAAFVSDVQSASRWQTVLTAEQINAWLAVQLPLEVPELGEQGVQEPRLILRDGEATLACRVTLRGVDSVVSVTAAPVVRDGGWVGLRVVRLRAGNLPLPVSTFAELLQTTVDSLDADPTNFRLVTDGEDSGPVILVNLDRVASAPGELRRVDAFSFRDGEVFFGGVTERIRADEPPAALPSLSEP